MIIQIKNKALADALDIPVNTNFEIASRGNIPTVKEWRNRLRDAKTDGCIEIVTSKTKGKK